MAMSWNKLVLVDEDYYRLKTYQVLSSSINLVAHEFISTFSFVRMLRLDAASSSTLNCSCCHDFSRTIQKREWNGPILLKKCKRLQYLMLLVLHLPTFSRLVGLEFAFLDFVSIGSLSTAFIMARELPKLADEGMRYIASTQSIH